MFENMIVLKYIPGGPCIAGSDCAGPGLQLLPRHPAGECAAVHGACDQQLQVHNINQAQPLSSVQLSLVFLSHSLSLKVLMGKKIK